MFVYKHTETVEYIKKSSLLFKTLRSKLYGCITREFLGLRSRKFKVLFLYELEHIGRLSNLH